jgi:hypothetical protein
MCGLLDALVCADFQVGPFRRTSAPHDLELFADQGLLVGTGKVQLFRCEHLCEL